MGFNFLKQSGISLNKETILEIISSLKMETFRLKFLHSGYPLDFPPTLMMILISEYRSIVHMVRSSAAIRMAVTLRTINFFANDCLTVLLSVPKKFLTVLADVTIGKPLLSNSSSVSISGS